MGVPQDKQDLYQGLILVGLARCIGIVLSWAGPAGEDNEHHLLHEVISLILPVILLEPFALLFTVVISQGPNHDADISNTTVSISVPVFLGSPLGAANVARVTLRTFLSYPGTTNGFSSGSA